MTPYAEPSMIPLKPLIDRFRPPAINLDYTRRPVGHDLANLTQARRGRELSGGGVRAGEPGADQPPRPRRGRVDPARAGQAGGHPTRNPLPSRTRATNAECFEDFVGSNLRRFLESIVGRIPPRYLAWVRSSVQGFGLVVEGGWPHVHTPFDLNGIPVEHRKFQCESLMPFA